MQYGNPVPQGKPDSSLESVIYPWFSVSGYYFDVINTLQEFAASRMLKKTHRSFSNNNFKTVC